jgi:hypothetical protein
MVLFCMVRSLMVRIAPPMPVAELPEKVLLVMVAFGDVLKSAPPPPLLSAVLLEKVLFLIVRTWVLRIAPPPLAPTVDELPEKVMYKQVPI